MVFIIKKSCRIVPCALVNMSPFLTTSTFFGTSSCSTFYSTPMSIFNTCVCSFSSIVFPLCLLRTSQNYLEPINRGSSKIFKILKNKIFKMKIPILWVDQIYKFYTNFILSLIAMSKIMTKLLK
jgi:hypothetical protein